jgi:hypothetical protein
MYLCVRCIDFASFCDFDILFWDFADGKVFFFCFFLFYCFMTRMTMSDICNYKKSFKIPKKKSEFVNRKRTDNTMAKRKKDKQRSTTHTHEAKDRVSLKTRGELSLP